MEFKFSQHKKVIAWECTTFSVEANSYEEAVKMAEQAKENDLVLCPGLMQERIRNGF